jgi:hypothetical protein
MISIGVLCFIGLAAYYWNHVGSNDPSPTTLLWIVFGIGFLLTGKGLIDVRHRLDRKRRIVLAMSLFSFGIISFVLALAIAHEGAALLILAIPAMFFGAMVCLMR